MLFGLKKSLSQVNLLDFALFAVAVAAVVGKSFELAVVKFVCFLLIQKLVSHLSVFYL